jgi:RNA polymerase subunit RPABC4/transcription elongation factor Spt4
MAEIQCGKCGEMVDEAKAFCPGCGHSFVDEKQRTSVSDYDQSKRTVQLGATMFNQMLSDMGLDISKQPDREEKRTELVTPLVPDGDREGAVSKKSRQVSPRPPLSRRRQSG